MINIRENKHLRRDIQEWYKYNEKHLSAWVSFTGFNQVLGKTKLFQSVLIFKGSEGEEYDGNLGEISEKVDTVWCSEGHGTDNVRCMHQKYCINNRITQR